ncbi:TetR family transcriptional regulator [Mycobacterium sp. NPDC050853]|uniref:TetR/AcrR family transcriptional regulator n=1 Tax=Mycobacteriaceae TaxID=1762 RepID=UPI0015DE6C7B|nr:TetR/AcrR family transcriptional regulator [Mycobacteroides sp. LB1]
MTTSTNAARRGRRRGEAVSREHVLDIAKRSFAERGYEKTTMRGIARDAGIDPSMVVYLFGSKDELFRQSIRLMIDPNELVLAIRNGEGTIGERFVNAYLSMWEQAGTVDTMLAILQSATTNDDAHHAFREFMQNYVLAALSEELGGGPEVRTRFALAATSMVGTALLRYALKIDPLVALTREQMVAVLAPTVDRYLTADASELGLPG